MNKTSSIIISVVFVVTVVYGVYFFIFKSSDSLETEREQIQNSLVKAELKLKHEKEKLNSLKKGLQDSFPLAVNVQGQMKKSFEVVKQTDFMFSDPYGLNPQLIVRSSASSLLLNDQRKKINAMLARWQKEIDLLSIEKINIQESEKIKKDIEAIKVFIKNLTVVVKELTPQNSGLSQYQIDTFTDEFLSSTNIDEILVSIENAIKDPTSTIINNNISTSNNSQTITQKPVTVQDTPSSQPPVLVDLFTSKVLPADVYAAQVRVEEAQKEVDVLKQQLAQIENQIQPPTPAPVLTPPVVDSPPIITPPPVDIVDDRNPGIQRIKYEGILVQPGPPRLIQGSDAY